MGGDQTFDDEEEEEEEEELVQTSKKRPAAAPALKSVGLTGESFSHPAKSTPQIA